MEHFLLVKLSDGRELLLNELQVCSVDPQEDSVLVRMADGEVFQVSDPPWEQWLNDFLARSQ